MAASKVALCLTALAHTASAVTLQKEDPPPQPAMLARESLVQGNLSTDVCKCIGWADAYSLHQSDCGMGHELDAALPMAGMWAAKVEETYKKYCTYFYKLLPNTGICMGTIYQDMPEQWCYVSKDCMEGNLTYTKAPLKTRWCAKGRDFQLQDMKFEKLAEYAKTNGLDVGLAARAAYPTVQGLLMRDIMHFWGLRPAYRRNHSAELLNNKTARQLLGSNKSYVLMSKSGEPPFSVVEGPKMYWIDYTGGQRVRMKISSGATYDEPQEMTKWGCVAGCEHTIEPF